MLEDIQYLSVSHLASKHNFLPSVDQESINIMVIVKIGFS